MPGRMRQNMRPACEQHPDRAAHDSQRAGRWSPAACGMPENSGKMNAGPAAARTLSLIHIFDAFPDIQYHMDEPQSNPSSVPLYFLAQLAREEVTVVLSGEGADEIFAGYEWYADTPAMEKFKRLPLGVRRAAAAAAKKLPYFKGKNFLLKCSERPEDYFFARRLYSRRTRPAPCCSPLTTTGRWLMSWPRRSTPVSKDRMK